MNVKNVFCLVLVTLVLTVICDVDIVRTPFGDKPVECVLEVPHGARVEDHPDGTAAVLVTLLDGSSFRHESPPICKMHAVAEAGMDGATTSDMSCNEPPCTCTSLPCNNWIDNAGSMNTERLIGGMSAVYVTPETPTSTTDNQTLFYFIGAENTNGFPRSGNPVPSGRAILQPVLTFDPSAWCNVSETGWCFASWYCCPQDLVVHSAYLQDVRPHDQFLGSFNLSDNGQSFTILSRNLRTKEETNLACPRQDRNFNWADITQEVYDIGSCGDFAVGKMWFQNVTLWDVQWTPMNPTWLFTSGKPCRGIIQFDGNSSFWIEHETTTPSSSPSPKNTAAIVGGIVGGLALVIGVILVVRRLSTSNVDDYQPIQ